MQEISAGIWRWTAPHPEWRPAAEWGREVACFALELPEALLLVDPLAPREEEEAFWGALDSLVGSRADVAVLITVPYHVRSSAAVYERYRERASVSIWGHAAAGGRLRPRAPLETIEPGKELPAGTQAFAIGSPRRHEMPLFFSSHRAIAFGDAIVGVEGDLRVWESPSREGTPWYTRRFLPTLRPLLDLDVDHVLVTHGPPIIGGGREALARGLAAPPWSMRGS